MMISRYLFIYIVGACLFFFNIGKGIVPWQMKQVEKQLETIKPSKKKSKKIIEICKSKGLDKKGWIDVSRLSFYNSNHVNISIENGKVICNEGNQIVQVKVTHNEKISSINGNSFYFLYLDYVNTMADFKMINPLPIMSTGWDETVDFGINLSSVDRYDLNKNDKLFPNDFEAYIVCQKENEQAYFIPKHTNNIKFIAPPWEVSVDIKMYRNPLVAYGRQFKITVLDNIDILENKQRSFIWPIPLRSMIDVYTLYKMTKIQKTNMCFLSRDAVTYEVSLNCNNRDFWLNKKVFSSNMVLVLSFMNLFLLIQNTLVKDKDVKYHMIHNTNVKHMNHISNTLENIKNKGNLEDLVNNEHMKETVKDYSLTAKKIKNFLQLNFFSMATWFSFLLFWKAYDFFKLMREIKNMDKEFKKADFVYPWKLQSPSVYGG